jgi:hypothetical protein
MTPDEAMNHLKLVAQAADMALINGQSHRNVRASIQALTEHIKSKPAEKALKPAEPAA